MGEDRLATSDGAREGNLSHQVIMRMIRGTRLARIHGVIAAAKNELHR